MPLAIHTFTEQELEAPSLAWSSLAWYWGLSFLGMSPKYFEYMQSGEYEMDKAFFSEYNDEVNQIPGYGKTLTIKERFDRAVDYYEYCFIQGRKTSINKPWDYPPDIATMVSFRERMEAKPMDPNQVIDASITDLLAENEKDVDLWKAGGQIQREEQANIYAAKVKEALKYVEGEVSPRMSLTTQQLDKDTGFLEVGKIPDVKGVVPEDMDEVMTQEAQSNKLGDVYKQVTPKATKLISFGIIGRYYTAGHNLERAMWNPEAIKELSFAHHVTIKSWQQLMTYKRIIDNEEDY